MDQFITNVIRIFISNFPMIMTVLAMILGMIACLRQSNRPYSDIFLARLMFFAVGLSGIWGFVMHAFFSELAAQAIGWTTSPFQFEVAVANLGIGVCGIFGVRASKGYRIAVTLFTICFLWGAAAGHINQMIQSNNFAPGNAGSIFYNDLIMPFLLIIFLLMSKKT